MRGVSLLFVAATLVAATTGSLPAHAAGPIQPGALMSTSTGACTLNFVYDGTGSKAGKVYLGTAAHCAAAVGDDVSVQGGIIFGDVALLGNANSTQADYALIEVRPAYLSLVSPAVKGYPAYPTGVATTAAVGDLLQASGYGLGFGQTAETREKRQEVLTSFASGKWQGIGPLTFGDSGGPLVQVKTGKAVGIVSRVCIGLCTDEGPTVQGIITQATTAGFPVTLRTV